MILLRSAAAVTAIAIALPQELPGNPAEYGTLGVVFALAMGLVRIVERLIDRSTGNGRNGEIRCLERLEASLNATTTALHLLADRQKSDCERAQKEREDVLRLLRRILDRMAA